MRKNILALSIAAMVGGLGMAGGASAAVFTSGAADALRTDNTGIGHILAVPYFTTQNGNATLLSLTNTDTSNGKVVKIRFRGASNSDDIFDFQLLLSPGDVWTATVTQGADGRSVLATKDKSCTIPSIVGTAATGNPFVTTRLPSTFTDPQKAVETREGYVEILNMADIPKALQNGQATPAAPAAAVNPLWTAVKHVTGVAPCTASTLAALNTDPRQRLSASAAGTAAPGGERAASTLGLSEPTGGLFGNYTIINLASTTVFSGEAVAVRAVVAGTGANASGHLVYSPQTELSVGSPIANGADPTVVGPAGAVLGTAITDVNQVSADALFQQTGGVTDASNPAVAPVGLPRLPILAYDLPDLSTPYTTSSATALTQSTLLTRAFATLGVINETFGDVGVAAFTDWVFSMPTRRYHVAMDYNHTATVGNPDGRIFTTYPLATDTFFSLSNTSVFSKQICVKADGLTTFDREETTTTSGAVISPGQVTTLSFCGEASVLSFNAGGDVAKSVLGATVARKDVTTAALDGWTTIGTTGLIGPGGVRNGLPVIGKAYMKAFNGAVSAGVSGNFGITSEHRYTRNGL